MMTPSFLLFQRIDDIEWSRRLYFILKPIKYLVVITIVSVHQPAVESLRTSKGTDYIMYLFPIHFQVLLK